MVRALTTGAAGPQNLRQRVQFSVLTQQGMGTRPSSELGKEKAMRKSGASPQLPVQAGSSNSFFSIQSVAKGMTYTLQLFFFSVNR